TPTIYTLSLHDALPICTYVGEYDEDLVKQSIERELERRGQAFFLHNRVETIDETAVRVQALAPKARVRVAHGQMDEGVLEKVMRSEEHTSELQSRSDLV